VIETLAPNSIESSSTGESRPLATDQTTTAAPYGGGPKKKPVALGTKRKQYQAPADQVTIELPLYHGPRSHLDLVAVDHFFGASLKPFDSHLRLQELALRLVRMSSLQKGLERHH
jgi:hypothetical protein